MNSGLKVLGASYLRGDPEAPVYTVKDLSQIFQVHEFPLRISTEAEEDFTAEELVKVFSAEQLKGVGFKTENLRNADVSVTP